MIILNDTHLGVTRSAGTTPASQAALRDYLRTSLSILLEQHKGEHVVINGDLFDSFQVETGELIKAYEILARHMETGSLTAIMGNHDASAKGDKVSSFHLLCHFLKEAARANGYFHMIDHTHGLSRVSGNVFAISHCLNQSLFDLEIEKACTDAPEDGYLLLHCNYKNGFAEHSDHSLNLNDDQVGALLRAGWSLVLGHEHIGYELRSGRVIVVGNQFPSSCADCIEDPVKNALVINGSLHDYVETWRSSDHFIELDWRDAAEATLAHNFVRITGDATAAESADVIATISKFRQRHDENLFAVSNAVRIDGAEAISEMTGEAVSDIRAFDVLSEIYAELNPEEVACVKGLIDA